MWCDKYIFIIAIIESAKIQFYLNVNKDVSRGVFIDVFNHIIDRFLSINSFFILLHFLMFMNLTDSLKCFEIEILEAQKNVNKEQ